MNTVYFPKLNDVKKRFLPYPESAFKGLEQEPKITDFELKKELGHGSYGHVYLAVHKITRATYAIKAIDKRNQNNQFEQPYFIREIEIMYKIHHPNVVRLFSHFEDNNYCYFLMEYIPKGNIVNLMPKDKTKRLSTKLIASLIKDVISAVYYLHHMNPPILHRDIKPENVLVADNYSAKLTDFGWSNYKTALPRITVCGTPIYLAPEIINQIGHNEKVDNWCIGVLLFELVTGNRPFPGNDIETLKNNIRNMRINWPKDMNIDAKNLIMKILRFDPNERISLEEMLLHPFFTKFYPDAIKCLVKPDLSKKYKAYIVSKDNPETWDPETGLNSVKSKFSKVIKPASEIKGARRHISPQPNMAKININFDEVASADKYKNLQESYNLLKKHFDELNYYHQNNCFISVSKLNGDNNVVNGNGKRIGFNDLYNQYKAISLENQILRSKLEQYEAVLKEKNISVNLGNLTKINNNEFNFFSESENLILKIREEEQKIREKERSKYVSLMNKYEKTIELLQNENKGLKNKLG